MKNTELPLLSPLICVELTLAALLSRPTLTLDQIEQVSGLIQRADMALFRILIDQHRIWPCVYGNIKEHFTTAFPKELVEYLNKKHQQNIRRSHQQFKAYAELLHLFKSTEIPVQLIKGLPLAQKLYGDMAKRHSKDIDLVIPTDYISQAHEQLTCLGYHCHDLDALSERQRALYLGYHKDFQYRNKNGIALELHVRLADHSSRLSTYCTQQLFRETSPEKKQANEFVYLCWHGTQSLYHRLKWLLDIALYIENNPANDRQFIEKVTSLATQVDATRALTISWVLAHTLYGINLPDEIRRLYECDQISRLITRKSLYALNKPAYVNSMRYKLEWNICSILLPQQWSEKWFFLQRRFKPNILDIMLFPNIPDKFSTTYYLLRPISLFYRKVLGRG
jgi:hypothetical protein